MNNLSFSRSLPYFTRCVNCFLRREAPRHVYTNFILRRGCVGAPHRDTRSGPFPTAVLALTTTHKDEGLQDHLGRVYKMHNGLELAGTVVNIDEFSTLMLAKSFIVVM